MARKLWKQARGRRLLSQGRSFTVGDHEPRRPEHLMAMFRISADESGKLGKNTDYTSFCGYVAHVSEWERFELEWRNCQFRWQVPAVHMARIMCPDSKDDEWRKIKNEWGDECEPKRTLMLNDFAATVRSAEIVCVGAVVDAAHFRSLCAAHAKFKDRFKDPAYMEFDTLVMRGIEKTEIIDKCSPISLVVDDHQQFSIECYQYLNELKRNFPKVRDRIHGICIVNDKSYTAVQAADMIAFESRRLMVERMKDPQTPMSELYKSLTLYAIHQPSFYTPAVLDELSDAMS